MQTMNNLGTENESITYEAILLLSLFIILPNRDINVTRILAKNGGRLIEFVENFRRTEHKPKVVNTKAAVNHNPE